MSFSRAKIHRFNDVSHGTPSPAEYNVPTKCSSSGGIISKTERFPELHSPASSDNSSFVCTSSQPTFRTPNPPRKVKYISNRKQKPEALFQSFDETEALREKTVECNNKDLYIKELTEQLEEMKQELCDLKNQFITISEEKNLLETKREDDNKINLIHKNRDLENKIIKTNAVLHQVKLACTTIKAENESNLIYLLSNIETINQLFKTLNSLILEKEKDIENLHQQINKLRENHQKEIQQLEVDTLKTVTHMHQIIDEEKRKSESNLNECQRNKDKAISELKTKCETLQNDFKAKIKQLNENHKEATVLSEILMKEKCEDIERGWKMKMEAVEAKTEASLQEYQTIVESNALQNEMEKNKLLDTIMQQSQELENVKGLKKKLTAECDYLQNQSSDLRAELGKLVIELNTTREENSKELLKRDILVNQATRDKHLYEMTIQKTHKTVEALKKRLLKSDHDVEQLKAELEATEESKLEVEAKCNQLMEELDIVTGLCDVIEEQNELAVKVAEERIANVKEELLRKVDCFKIQAEEELKLQTEANCKTKEDLKETTELLHEQQILNAKAQTLLQTSHNEIDRLKCLVDEYSSKIVKLESAFNNAQEEIISLQLSNTTINENSKLKTVIEFMQASETDLLNQISDLKKQLQKKTTQCGQHVDEVTDLRKAVTDLETNFNKTTQKMNTLEDENKELRRTVNIQNALIGPFRSNLQAYEKEYSMLLSEKENVEKEAKEISLKYAEILGHQNKKQKIKYMVDLKKQNLKLVDENKAHARLIQKLQSELATFKHTSQKNKENISLNSSRVESPGPLRELKENIF